MITSVVVIFAIVLLERVIPYTKQIRGLQDSLQAYYRAKWEIEIAKNDFIKKQPRTNTGAIDRIVASWKILELGYPNISPRKRSEYVIVSNNFELPLQIRMFEKDTIAQSFGTSPQDPNFHAFTQYSGGLFFDLSKMEASGINFSMEVHTDTENENKPGSIKVEFVYTSGNGTIPFFGAIKETPLWPIDGKNIRDAIDTNREAARWTLSFLMGQNNCRYATCALKLQLEDTASTIPVAFSLSSAIPDLNAVVIADGLSEKGNYHSRVIELIPFIQSI
jgi:hypothetical protein